jgi:hypothetical protein
LGVAGGPIGLSAVVSGRGSPLLNSPIKSVVLAVDGRVLTAVRPLLRGFSAADAWSELFDANVCSTLSAFCFLTSFSTARVHLVFAPVNNSRRSMSLQEVHKNVWCSHPGSVVGSAGTTSIKSISALHTKHRIAQLVLQNETHGAEGARDDQARPSRELSGCAGHTEEPATPLLPFSNYPRRRLPL